MAGVERRASEGMVKEEKEGKGNDKVKELSWTCDGFIKGEERR